MIDHQKSLLINRTSKKNLPFCLVLVTLAGKTIFTVLLTAIGLLWLLIICFNQNCLKQLCDALE